MSTQRSSTPNKAGNNRANKRGTTDDQDDKMHVADGLHVVVRLLQSTSLEGAFRVHVLPESLLQAGLKVGDVCEISSEDGSNGYGIAWRANDGMGTRPKNRPIKMTETIRSAFGFEEGSTVTIAKTNTKVLKADRIVLSDVTPPEYNKPDDEDDGCWRTRTANLFMNCDALAPGIAFDVTGRKKYRKRFYIESIDARDAPVDTASLFQYTDSTQLVLPGSIAPAPINGDIAHHDARTTNGIYHSPFPIDSSARQFRLEANGIGGLLDQCQLLNRQLQRLLNSTVNLSRYGERRGNPPVLLSGHEGTGKTILLDTIAKAGFKQVIRLDRAALTGGAISRNQDIIQQQFDKASKSQPSLVLMDDLETLVPTDDLAYSKALASGIASLRGQKVMIVAATRAPTNIKSSVARCFGRKIELPIPDTAAREQILNVLQAKPMFAQDTLSTTIASRTHGFTGSDLEELYRQAEVVADDRYDDECEQLEMARSPTPPAYEEIADRLDGCHISTETGYPSPALTIADFEVAMKNAKPTALREIFTEKPKVGWRDIGGSGDMQKNFDEIIGWPLQFGDMLGKINYPMPKGVLLYGPPGCSKTLTAQAVANTYNFNFIAIKGAELVSMYVGESERAVREVFRKAKTAAPCIIFFDEIDSIGSKREIDGNKGLNVLTTLLNEMDGFDTLKNVFVLAATNQPEILDPALMRPGRFDSHIYLGPPNSEARREILTIATRGVALSADVNFDSLVAHTDGYSGAEIVSIAHAAKKPAFRRYIKERGEVRVTSEDFSLALNERPRGITREMLEAYEAFSRRGTD